MAPEVGSWDLVKTLFDASVSPERLEELIARWDAQIEHAGPEPAIRLADCAGAAFATQLASVLGVLEQLHAAELRRVNDLLSRLVGAAMVLAGDGEVIALNDAAAAVFGLRPGATIHSMRLDACCVDDLVAPG